MIRLQTGESREQRVFLTDDDGAPLAGLQPTATARRGDTGAALANPTVRELGGGFYAVAPASTTVDQVLVVDRGTPGPGRYVALEVLVGGYVDRLDAAITSRATAAAVSDLGTPAQAAALASTAAGVLALLERLTAPRAGLLDQLTLLDAAVTTRAPGTDTAALLNRLTALRAAALDLLDTAVSSRATPDDVSTSGSSTRPSIQGVVGP